MQNIDRQNSSPATFRRSLRLRDIILYGIVVIQPTAPMPVYGVVSQEAKGHVIDTILIALVAMLFTAVSYGRMARVYPSAGSAYTYVSQAIHPGLGYLTGWAIAADYLLNPIICTIWCSKAASNFVPYIPYWCLAASFALLFTLLNLRGIESTAKVNLGLTVAMSAVVVVFFGFAAKYLSTQPDWNAARLLLPFYDPRTYALPSVLRGSAIAVLTYIGFDGISTLSEEVEDAPRNILRGIVLTCLITGVLASLEVYAGQLIWPDYSRYPDLDTAFVYIAGRAGGPFLFVLMNLTLLVATVGSGFGSQLGAARLLYGMGRDGAIPQRFFGQLDGVNRVPRNNVIFCGVLALLGALLLNYQLGAEMLNFGAFIAFIGVNAAALSHYCIRGGNWSVGMVLPPVLGILVCAYIWANLSSPAKTAGFLWLAAGGLYGLWKGSLFRKAPVPS